MINSKRLFSGLFAIGMVLLASPANAQVNGKPYQSPYAGLVPSGFAVQEAPAPFVPSGKTLAIVTSANYETYIARWTRVYEKSGGRNFIGGDLSALKGASDPRELISGVVSTVKPYFKAVQAASDLRDARDNGADYIMIVDLYGDLNGLGTNFRTRAGVYVLDAGLRHVFTLEAKGETPYDAGGLTCMGECQTQQMIASVRRAMAVSATPLLASLQAKMAGH